VSTTVAADIATTTHHRDDARPTSSTTGGSVRGERAGGAYHAYDRPIADHPSTLSILAEPPLPPADVDRFTSNTLFGEPGIYPQGTEMSPAPMPPMTDDAVRAAVLDVVAAAPVPATRAIDDPGLTDAVPDLAIRAALVCLTGTVAAPLLDAFPHSTTVRRLSWGQPASPGRVVGPTPDDDPAVRVVNSRYRAEHPAIVAPSLAHDLLWAPDTAVQSCDALLHALLAMVQIQLVARHPGLADLGTELTRRQNSLAITLLNSRHPGDHRIALVAADGVGTIPGGAPALQSPDFWSIPFAPDGDAAAPPALASVLRAIAPGNDPPAPLRFSPALATWVDEHGAWLTPTDQLAAARALGLVGPVS
jgi:hypothetical protein